MTLLQSLLAGLLALAVVVGIEEWRIALLRADLAQAEAANATLTANFGTCAAENARAASEVTRAAAAAQACAALQGITIRSGAEAVARSRAEAGRLRDELATERTIRAALYGDDPECEAMAATRVCSSIEARLRASRQAQP